VLCCTVLYSTVLYCTVKYSTVLCCAVLYCTVLYCSVLYCTVLYCTVLYSTVLYCKVLYCAVLCCAVLCCTVLYSTVVYCTVLFCTVLYCTVLYCTAVYCTVLYCTVLYFTCRWLWKIKFLLTEVHFVGLHYMIISQFTAQTTKCDSSFSVVSKLQTVWPRNRCSIPYSTKSVPLLQVSPNRPASPHSLLLKGYRNPFFRKKVKNFLKLTLLCTFALRFMYISKEKYSIYCLSYISELFIHRKWIERYFHNKWRIL